MRAGKLALGLAVVLLLASPLAAADRYAIDPVHTFVGFAARHYLVSTVKGQFPDVSGEILLDEDDVTRSSVSVVIKAASIDTHNQRRDNDLRGAEFLNVERYPEITFKSKRVEKSGDAYVAVGGLTIRDVTKEIALPFTLSGPILDPGQRKRIGVEAGATINRFDYNVSWDRMFESGKLIVGPEVRIELNVEAIQVEPQPPQAAK